MYIHPIHDEKSLYKDFFSKWWLEEKCGRNAADCGEEGTYCAFFL